MSPKAYKYGIFIMVDQKSELKPLAAVLDRVYLDEIKVGRDFPTYRVGMKLSNYRVIHGEVKHP